MAQSGGYIDTRGDWSQRKQRVEGGILFEDDHGRNWHAEAELKTGGTVGPIQLQIGEPNGGICIVKPPIIPDQKYLERVLRRPYTLHINYERWIADIRGARREWEREGQQLARKLHGDAYDPRASFSADILEFIGEPPEAVEPVIAARQGNRWVLGLTEKVDKRLVKYFRPEQLDPTLRRLAEPDFRDIEEEDFSDMDDDLDDLEEKHDRGATGGKKKDPRSARPLPRMAAKGKGGGKSKPRSAGRVRGPSGQFLPAEETEPLAGANR